MSGQNRFPAPERAMVNVTGRCNSRCGYCRAWRECSGENDPTREELLSLMDQVADLGCVAVGFSGGEPLLRNDMEEIIARASERGLGTGAVTNGLLLTQERLKGLASAGLGSISVSLDSLDPATYECIRGVPLKKVLANIKAAAALEILPMSVSTTVSGHNVDVLHELVEFAVEIGIMISFQLYESDVHLAKSEAGFVPDENQLREAMDRLRRLKDEGAPITSSHEYLMTMPQYVHDGGWVGLDRCIAPSSEICVDEELCVHTCWGLDRKVGDLRTASLKDIWTSDAFDQARTDLKECRQCALSCHFDNSLRLLARDRAASDKGK